MMPRSTSPPLQPLGPLVSSHVREHEHHRPVAHHSLGFIVVTGELDCRGADCDGRPGVEFSWQGSDEGDDANGRGWAALCPDGTLEGHIYFHLGDDSGFRAERFSEAVR